eukprot:1857150-Prymnesium_polylepis.1
MQRSRAFWIRGRGVFHAPCLRFELDLEPGAHAISQRSGSLASRARLRGDRVCSRLEEKLKSEARS